MKVLAKRTYQQMIKPLPLLIVTIISLFFGFVLSYYCQSSFRHQIVFEEVVLDVKIYLIVIEFVLLTGLLLGIIVVNYASGTFASEIHEGTMKLLMAKQLSRFMLVVGKIGGLLLGNITYLILIQSTFLFSFVVFSGIERDVLIIVLKGVLSFSIYSLIVIFILTALGSFLSSCFKKKAPVTIILILIVMLIYMIIPIVRIYSSDIYRNYHLYYLDINYHFAIIYSQFISMTGSLEATGFRLEIINLFTNLYPLVSVDYDISNNAMAMINQNLNGTVVMVIYLLIASGFYWLTYQRIKKMDI